MALYAEYKYVLKQGQTSGSQPIPIPFTGLYIAVQNPTNATVTFATGSLTQKPPGGTEVMPTKSMTGQMNETRTITAFWSSDSPMAADKTVTFSFSDQPITLSVSDNGVVNVSGNVTVTVAPGQQIQITGTPTVQFAAGQTVSISGTPQVNVSNNSLAVTNAQGGSLTVAGTVAIGNTVSATITSGTVEATIQNAELNSNVINDYVSTNPTVTVPTLAHAINLAPLGYTYVNIPIPTGVYDLVFGEITTSGGLTLSQINIYGFNLILGTNKIITAGTTSNVVSFYGTGAGNTDGVINPTVLTGSTGGGNLGDNLQVRITNPSSSATIAGTITFNLKIIRSGVEVISAPPTVADTMSTQQITPVFFVGSHTFNVANLANGSGIASSLDRLQNMPLALANTLFLYAISSNGYLYTVGPVYFTSGTGATTMAFTAARDVYEAAATLATTQRSTGNFTSKFTLTYSALTALDGVNLTLVNNNGATIVSDTVEVFAFAYANPL